MPALLVVLALALSACGGSVDPPPPSPSQGIVVNRQVPGVVLTAADGSAVSMRSFEGRVVVLAPFLTLCQDECPLITGAFLEMEHVLDEAGLRSKVVFVTVSIDPWRDTRARLAAYAARFGADWTMLTGSLPTLEDFWTPFGVYFAKVPEGDQPTLDWWTGTPLTMDVLHTDGYVLLDARGRERFIDSNAPDVPTLRPDLKALLDRGGLAHFEHPAPTAWTVDDALASIAWLLGRPIPTPAS